MGQNPPTQGCKITVYYGHTRHTGEALDVDGGDDHVWYFDNAPVSTKNLRLIGTFGGEQEFIVNFDLEPLSGTLTIPAGLPAYTSIAASYFSYVNTEDGADLLTQRFKVHFPQPRSEVDIWGQPRYQIHNNYPHKLSFRVIITAEGQRNLLTTAMFRANYFLVIDKNFDASYGFRAYEGPLWSDESGSIEKGASYQLPIELFVQQFGKYTVGPPEAIEWGFWEN